MIAGRASIAIGLVAYGVMAVGSGLDRISRQSPALEYAVPSPFRAEADRAAASTALIRKDNIAAVNYARRAVASDPADTEAAALLGSALLISRQDDAADKAFRVAARFGWRDVATQGYFYDVALQEGDLRVAADRADALLRTHPNIVDQQRLLEPFESQTAGAAILAEHLQLRPAWMASYLALPANSSPEQLDRRFRVIAQLNSRKVSLGCDMVAPFAVSLLRSYRWEEAKTLWNANCPQAKITGPVGAMTFAGVDTYVGPELPFSWQPMRSGDVTLSHEGPANANLRVINSSSATRLILYQSVAFPPGAYQLRVHADGRQPATGTLIATIGCNGTTPYPVNPDGDLLTVGQTLRADQCPGQILSLWLSGSGSSAELQSLEIRKVG